jgi:hypothetical protein
METVERAGVMHEAPSFGFEHPAHRLRCLFGMAMGLGMGDAFVEQPDIEILQTVDPQARREDRKSRPHQIAVSCRSCCGKHAIPGRSSLSTRAPSSKAGFWLLPMQHGSNTSATS